MLEALSPAERDELTEIHRALERIERGIFGKCEACAGRIEAERIDDEPWRALCGSCDDDRDETVACRDESAAHADQASTG